MPVVDVMAFRRVPAEKSTGHIEAISESSEEKQVEMVWLCGMERKTNGVIEDMRVYGGGGCKANGQK